MTPFDAATAPEPHKNTAALPVPAQKLLLQRCRQVSERVIVQAIDAWLRGDAWACEDAAYHPYHGYHIRLRERGDHLVMLRSKKDTVAAAAPVVCRNPVETLKGPDGIGATMHCEARALCNIAIRGDAGMYGS